MKFFSRNKWFTVTNIILMAAVFGVLFFYTLFFLPETDSYSRCEGNVTMTVSYENIIAIADASVQFFPKDKHDGVLRITGTLFKDGKTMDINRSYAIRFSHVNKTNYEVIVRKETALQMDGVQQGFFYHDFFPEKIGAPFIVSVLKVNDNAVLVEGLANPYFICTLTR